MAIWPIEQLYAKLPSKMFGVIEYRAVRKWWLSNPIETSAMAQNRKPSTKLKSSASEPRYRSRQYINKQMKRLLRVIKWGVAAGMVPSDNHIAIKCVDPLKRGRTEAPEAKAITAVSSDTVAATIPHLTHVLADMMRFQQRVGCRPGELVAPYNYTKTGNSGESHYNIKDRLEAIPTNEHVNYLPNRRSDCFDGHKS